MGDVTSLSSLERAVPHQQRAIAAEAPSRPDSANRKSILAANGGSGIDSYQTAPSPQIGNAERSQGPVFVAAAVAGKT